MINIIVEISKYVLLLLMLIFTIYTYSALRTKSREKRVSRTRGQLVVMVFFDFAAFAVMYIQTYEFKIIIIYLGLIAYILFSEAAYKIFYRRASFVLLNTMCMLISIGLVIQTRLDADNALKQLIIAAGATVLALVIPVIIRKAKVISRWGLFFAAVGILLLAAVFALAAVTGGGKLSIEIGGITFQFSEIAKLTFVFFIAAMLHNVHTFRQVCIVTLLAAIHVIILVASTDLGTALVFFVAYIVMVCVATRRVGYAFIGLGGIAAASVAAYKLFSHIRVRVQVWQDPFRDYQGTGYQIVQALFSICAGGWFGTGLMKGSPDMVPVVEKDFTFAAICEEMGILFAICLILLCMCCYLIIVNISMKVSNEFYRLIAIGLGTEYAFQVFLTIGGSVKMIPMTGITLPLISYGGSSITCSIFMFAIVQGLYLLRKDEADMEDMQVPGGWQDDIPDDEYYSDEDRSEYVPGEETEEFERRIWKETENSIND
ncbi:MAG: FtsW/RodA/SpoVE family cell cycle protein [Lachnospiraceae bacterium]|nr:FtsW/RodA/SpoVE family cell cycle protein [Lachnospiraceae bacterium]